jgi:hypothetical protein
MFRDQTQASHAIRLLLGGVGLEALWTDAGPAPALLHYEDGLARLTLPPMQRTLLLAAWCLWTPAAPGVTLSEVIGDLDQERCSALCSLVVAYVSGADAVDAWIEAAAPAVPPAPDVAPPASEGALSDDWPTLDMLSLRYVGRVLDRVKENKTRAAEVLGVDRRTVSRFVAARRKGLTPTMQTQERRTSRRAGGQGPRGARG